MTYPRLAMLALPYTRLELPGWGRVMRGLGVYADERWVNAPRRRLRGKWHGYRLTVDLANWSERCTYFLGRFYDLPTQLVLRATLRPGETFIDVGANIGMMTILGAHLVGRHGRVIAFEPNPVARERAIQVVRDNGLDQVDVRPVALGDAAATLTLSVVTDHTGMGTLAALDPATDALVSSRHEVAVVRGDDVLPDDLPGPIVIKLDVEGFECRALAGLAGLIARERPAVVTEAVPQHLERAGASLEDLFDLMHGHGYVAFRISTRRAGWRHHLALESRPAATATGAEDVLWLADDGPHRARLLTALAAGGVP